MPDNDINLMHYTYNEHYTQYELKMKILSGLTCDMATTIIQKEYINVIDMLQGDGIEPVLSLS